MAKAKLTRGEAKANLAAVVKEASSKSKEFTIINAQKEPEVHLGPAKSKTVTTVVTEKQLIARWAEYLEAAIYGNATIGIGNDEKAVALIRRHPEKKPFLVKADPSQARANTKIRQLDSISAATNDTLKVVATIKDELGQALADLKNSQQIITRNFQTQWKTVEKLKMDIEAFILAGRK